MTTKIIDPNTLREGSIVDLFREQVALKPVEIAHRSLDGRQSPGVKVCARLNQPVLVAVNSVGAQDSYCRFPDGSLISTGALERYAMRVVE